MYNNTYQNNHTYGSPCRPICLSTSVGTISGVQSLILTSDIPFFDELRYGCEPCSIGYAVITNCIEFGQILPVYVTDDGGVTFTPVRTRNAGLTLMADQIQEYGGSRKIIKLLNVYDAESVQNNHINILSPICPKHRPCDCPPTTPAPAI